YRADYPGLTVESESAYSRCLNHDFVISEIGRSDIILVVGSDLISEHPNVHLWTRKAVYENGAKLYTANPFETKSGDCSFDELIYSPGSEVALLNGLTLGILDQGLAPKGFNSADSSGLLEPNTIDACAKKCGVSVERLESCARDLAEAKTPCLIGGEIISTSVERETISRALSNLSAALGIKPGKKGQSLILPKAANSKGAEALGLTPDPPEALRKELTKILNRYPELKGLTASQMYDSARVGELSGMVLIGSNPVQFSPDSKSVEKALKSLDFLLVADLFMTPTAEMADVALPLSSFAEYDGAFVNLEGRQQDFSAGMKPVGESLPGFEALNKIAEKLGCSLYSDSATLNQEIEKTLDSFDSAPNKQNLIEAKAKETAPTPGEEWYPIYVGDALHHFGSWTTHCESLRAFDPEAYLEVSPRLASSLGIESGELVRVSNDNKRVNLKLKISERLKGNVVFAPNNFDLSRVDRFTSGIDKVSYVRIEKINES
ncbi:MAG: molybdopterin-dependent oxidoreductase, partial [candidate division Zixibacteria bacterium]|nr:molybdopterin-dependent oxidoreductase [candidate division Zixibacteria bacterium]